MEWFLQHRPDLCCNVTVQRGGVGGRMILSAVDPEQLRRILARMLSEDEFLSPYGIRSLSRYHKDHPFVLNLDGTYAVDYEPGESKTGQFGGNSNWRGPAWMPVNYLLIESLQKCHHYFGRSFRVECPAGSGRMKTLWEVSQEISQRLIHTFEKDSRGRRPFYYGMERFENDPDWEELLQFYECFNAETGGGVGASHQTGWTGLIAKLIQQHSEYGQKKQTGSQD